MMIKAVIFDCFGVLTTSYWNNFLDDLDASVDKQKLDELIRQLDVGFINKKEFIDQVFEISGQRPSEVENLNNNQIVKNIDLINYIKSLKNKNYKIGMISNISSNWIKEVFLTSEEIEIFDEMILSYEVKIAKPDPRIFEITLNRLNVNKGEAIFVDDIESNCFAANNSGLIAIKYNNNKDLIKRINKLIGEDLKYVRKN